MKEFYLKPGSQEWLKARSASKAPAVMGDSAYQSRSSLVKQTATGITEEVDSGTQSRFDNGHRVEALARVIASEIFGEDLKPKPCITDDGYLTANLDGYAKSFIDTIGWEHKDWNEDLAAAVRACILPASHYWQLEQQILVAELDYVLFMVSDGTREKCVWMEYRAVPGRAEKLLAAWKQFDEDVANYQHVDVVQAAVAAPQMALPALTIQVSGSISLRDNLAVFGEQLTSYVAKINKKPETDQDFADLESCVKTLKAAEAALETAESTALAQTSTIDEMRRTVALYKDLARQNRLLVEKLVKGEKENRRAALIRFGQAELSGRIAKIHDSLGIACISVTGDFAGAVKGLKSIASIQSAVNDEVARATIEANAIADRVRINAKALNDSDAKGLFPDFAHVCTKDSEDFVALVAMRIGQRAEADEKRLAAEREKIRAEEERKAQEKIRLEQEAIAKAATPITPAYAIPMQAPSRPVARVIPPANTLASVGRSRPSDSEIIEAIAIHFRVHESLAISWLLEMGLDEATEQMAKEFAA